MSSKKSLNLNFLQLNLHKSNDVNKRVFQYVDAGLADIALVQEPNVRDGRITGMGNRLIYSAQTARAAILCSGNMQDKILKIEQLCNRDMATAVINVTQRGGNIKKIVVCSLYIPCGDEIDLNNLDLVINYAKTMSLDLIICTDSNSHHTLWFDDRICNRGETLADFMGEKGIMAHNRNAKTFFRRNCATAIDLTLTFGNIGANIINWKVQNLCMGSDHHSITFELHSITKKTTSFRNIRKTDWDKFKTHTKEKLSTLVRPIHDSNQAEEITNKLIKTLNDAFSVSCEKVYVRRRNGKLWYDKNLNEKKQDVRSKWKEYYEFDEESNPEEKDRLRMEFKKSRNEYNRASKETSDGSYEKFATDIETTRECARLTNVQKKISNCNLNTLKQYDGSFTKEAEDSVKLLLDTHFPDNI